MDAERTRIDRLRDERDALAEHVVELLEALDDVERHALLDVGDSGSPKRVIRERLLRAAGAVKRLMLLSINW